MAENEPLVINAADAEEIEHRSGQWGGFYKVLTPGVPRMGHLGVNLSRLPPGHTTCPFHYHMLEDEVFYVLRGRGVLRYGDSLREIGPGDCVACPAGTRIAHQIANPFDEDLESYGEDVDLSLRARRRGFRLRYVPQARIAHLLGATHGRYGARKCYLVERNRVRAAVRSLPWTALVTMPAWTGLRVTGLALAALGGHGWGARVERTAAPAALAGMLSGLAHVPDALAKRAQDAQAWRVDEREMWGHLLRHRVRARDLFRS